MEWAYSTHWNWTLWTAQTHTESLSSNVLLPPSQVPLRPDEEAAFSQSLFTYASNDTNAFSAAFRKLLLKDYEDMERILLDAYGRCLRDRSDDVKAGACRVYGELPEELSRMQSDAFAACLRDPNDEDVKAAACCALCDLPEHMQRPHSAAYGQCLRETHHNGRRLRAEARKIYHNLSMEMQRAHRGAFERCPERGATQSAPTRLQGPSCQDHAQPQTAVQQTPSSYFGDNHASAVVQQTPSPDWGVQQTPSPPGSWHGATIRIPPGLAASAPVTHTHPDHTWQGEQWQARSDGANMACTWDRLHRQAVTVEPGLEADGGDADNGENGETDLGEATAPMTAKQIKRMAYKAKMRELNETGQFDVNIHRASSNFRSKAQHREQWLAKGGATNKFSQGLQNWNDTEKISMAPSHG